MLRERHRAARERDRDRGRELEPLGVLGREQQREERVVRPFEGEDAVVADALRARARARARVEVGGGERGVDFHRASASDLLRWADGSTTGPKPTASASPTSTTSGTSRRTRDGECRPARRARGGGRALELGIGTGRIAIPLAARRRRGARHRLVAGDGRAAARQAGRRPDPGRSSATWRTSPSTASSRWCSSCSTRSSC